MSLTPPVLDTRRFDDLVAEARARIPRFTPEWTNFNESDPGMTLVKLHAWMTETILYELNRVPDLNYIQFLNLIGLRPRPAEPARTQLTFTLDKLDKPTDALIVHLPLGAKVAVDDPDLAEEVIFETDASFPALNGAIGAVIVPKPGQDDKRVMVTEFDSKEQTTTWLHAFAPFGGKVHDPEQSNNPPMLYLALLVRPHLAEETARYSEDVLPAGPLDLHVEAVQVFDEDARGEIVQGPKRLACPPPGATDTPIDAIEWQIFTAGADATAAFDQPRSPSIQGGWKPLNLSRDETRGLTRSGHIVLEIPEGAPRLNPRDLPADFWDSFDQPKPPATVDELLSVVDNPGLGDIDEKHWQAMGVTDQDDLAELLACKEDPADIKAKIEALAAQISPDALSAEDWAAIHPAFAVDLPKDKAGEFRQLYWLRAVLKVDVASAELREIRLNTVPATQAATRLDDQLGRSNGRPGQVFELPKSPVLIDPLTKEPVLELVVTEGDTQTTWTRVDDFYNQGPESTVFVLDPNAGMITFGDGRAGRVPVADAQITARKTRIGGGAIGNVAAGKITALKGKLRGFKSVTNARAAAEGSDAEPLEAAKLRAPHDLRTRDRAITFEDFSYLAKETPGVAVHTAYALAGKRPKDGAFVSKAGAVTVVVLPTNSEPTPQPSEAQLRTLCQWLEPRRLVTTELYVTGPRYTKIGSINARLTVLADHDLAQVTEAATQALLDFMHPLTGGRDRQGWPFGEDIFHGDLYDLLLGQSGIRRVSGLHLTLDRVPDADPTADVTALPEGHLPDLRRAVIDLDVRYD